MNEPTSTTFSVIGMVDREAVTTIETAVRNVDPVAVVAVSMSTGLANVRSSAPVERIRQAIEARGFIVQPTDRAFPPRQTKSKVGARALLDVVGRALLLGLVCACLVPVVTFVVLLVLQHFDRSCGTPGDSGGCAMGLLSATILSIAPGAVLGFLIALVHGVLRLANTVSSP
jgi:copper chaperone CopZ